MIKSDSKVTNKCYFEINFNQIIILQYYSFYYIK